MAALTTLYGICKMLWVLINGSLLELTQQIVIAAVSLFWIKAHAGLPGNERADELAKEAALSLRRKPDYDQCPISFIRRQIRMGSLDEWNRRYVSGETASVTKMFLPDAIAAFRIVKQVRPTGVLTQILTGHGGFSEYLNRFKCKESPSCACDPNAEETVPHIILDCPIFARERYRLECELDTAISRNTVSEVMSGKKRDTFLSYCENVAMKKLSIGRFSTHRPGTDTGTVPVPVSVPGKQKCTEKYGSFFHLPAPAPIRRWVPPASAPSPE
nr:uncharacterized protein LOC126053945 [Helicoverpa armigera]